MEAVPLCGVLFLNGTVRGQGGKRPLVSVESWLLDGTTVAQKGALFLSVWRVWFLDNTRKWREGESQEPRRTLYPLYFILSLSFKEMEKSPQHRIIHRFTYSFTHPQT